MITSEELRQLLDYCEATGEFRRKVPTYRRNNVGEIAGSVGKNGYVYIRVNGRKYLAHRLAYLYVFGKFPNGLLDHRNRNPADNRIANIRDASLAENSANAKIRRDNSSGARGVTRTADGKRWRARGHVDNKEIHLGIFSRFDDAVQAYRSFAEKTFGEFFNLARG
jgi:hypothetical protein